MSEREAQGPTLPPKESEAAGVAEFEARIKEVGEARARLERLPEPPPPVSVRGAA